MVDASLQGGLFEATPGAPMASSPAAARKRGVSFKHEWFELMPEECCEWFKHHIQGMVSFHSQQLRYWQEIGSVAHKKPDPASSRSKSTHRSTVSHNRAALASESTPEPASTTVVKDRQSDQAMNGRKPMYKSLQKVFAHKGKPEQLNQSMSNPDGKRNEDTPLSHAVLDRPLVNREQNRRRHSSGAGFRIEMEPFKRNPTSNNTQFNPGVEAHSVQTRENEGFRNGTKPQRMTAEAIKIHQKRHQMTPPYARKGDRSDIREEIRKTSPIAHVTASVKGGKKVQGHKPDRPIARRTESESNESDEEENVITIMQLAHRGPEQRVKGTPSRAPGPVPAHSTGISGGRSSSHKQAAGATASNATARPHRPPGPPPARAMTKQAIPAWVTPTPLDRQQRSISAQPPFDGDDDDVPPPPPPAGSPPPSQVHSFDIRDDNTRRVLESRPPPRAGHTMNSSRMHKKRQGMAAGSNVDSARSPIDRRFDSATQRAVYQTSSKDKSSQRSRQHRSEHSSSLKQGLAFDKAPSSSAQRSAHNPKRLANRQSAGSSARNNKEKATAEMASANEARLTQPASRNEATLGPMWGSKRFSEPMALHTKPRNPASRSRNASVTSGGLCKTCGCDDFSLNAFKAGSCNNCFHEHQN